MVADNGGNLYIIGYYTGTVQLGSTQLSTGNVPAWNKQSFIAKLDATGTYQWALDLAGDVRTNTIRLLAADGAGNVYLAGTYTGTGATFGTFQLTSTAATTSLYVAKLAPDGTYLWARQASGNGVGVNGLAADQNGNVYLTGGYTGASATFGSLTLQNSAAGHSTAYVAKLAASGVWQWATQATNGNQAYEADFGQALAVDAQGNTYVAGSFGSAHITLGATTLTNNNAYGFTCDAFVAKLDSTGQWVWGHRIGSAGYDRGQDLAVDANGDVVLTGYMHGPVDGNSWVQPLSTNGNFEVFVARLSPSGTPRWAVGAGGDNVDLPTQLALDAAGNAYVTGYFDSSAAHFGTATVTNARGQTNYEAFVAQIDPAGTWQWAQQTLSSTSYTESQGLGVDPSGTVWLFGGSNSATIQFSGLTQPQPGTFIARLGSAIYPTLVSGIAPASGQAGQQVTVTGARFTGVTGVFFNNIPAASFNVLSSTKLQAVVPAGATTGSVSVRTAAGANGPAPVFKVVAPLATGPAQTTTAQLWPVPVAAERLLHLRLPLAPSQPGWAVLHSALGAEVRAVTVQGAETPIPLHGLATGLYVLRVQVPGQAPLTYRLALE